MEKRTQKFCSTLLLFPDATLKMERKMSHLTLHSIDMPL